MKLARGSSRRASALIAAATGLVAVCAIGFAAPPLDFPACLFRLVTGGPCPACGMTHAFIALAHGRILDAIHCNLMSPLVFAAMLLAFVVSLFDLLAGTACLHRLWTRVEHFVVPLTLVLALIAWSWNIYKASVG